MAARVVEFDPTFEGWQAAARALLGESVAPAEVEWRETAGAPPAPATAKYFRVPRQFLDVARQAAAASSPARWPTLYEVLWRIVHERRELLDDRADATVRRLHGLAAQARREAEQRERAEVLELEAQGGGASAFVPAAADLAALAEAAKRCEGCPLHRDATQTVFGRGPRDARIVLVGEQPGDQEDLRGAPFVGPAGEILDRALGEAELALIEPETLVCLGATAARSLLGPDFRLMRDRGRVFGTAWAPRTLATFHPSAVLRGEDDAAKEELYRTLVGDLRLAVS